MCSGQGAGLPNGQNFGMRRRIVQSSRGVSRARNNITAARIDDNGADRNLAPVRSGFGLFQCGAHQDKVFFHDTGQ